MSDTPRTDAALELKYGTLATISVLEDHARELERELARAMRVVEAAKLACSWDILRPLAGALEEWDAGR